MRLTPILHSNISNICPRLSCINASLNTAQLRHIAQATGIQTSGTKGVLLDRLLNDIVQSEYAKPASASKSKSKSKSDHDRGNGNGNAMSILSIDMGVKNLAFAHLLVDPPNTTTIKDGGKTVSISAPKVRLNAWRRLAVSEVLDQNHQSSIFGSGVSSPSSSAAAAAAAAETGKSKATEEFSPTLYAEYAYTLITSLLKIYQPTHVLIERQRFRSGGGSSVLEWTIRVGVFEGMLHAVLRSVRRGEGRAGSDSGLDPHVQGVEPKRVASFWGDPTENENGEGDGEGLGDGDAGKEKGKKMREKKKAMTSREGKKIKINLVRRWLVDCLEAEKQAQAQAAAGQVVSTPKISGLGPSPELRVLVDSYISTSEGKKKRQSRKDGGGLITDIGKLDDLADCLLQGVTWLEWQVMRKRICLEGLDVVGFN